MLTIAAPSQTDKLEADKQRDEQHWICYRCRLHCSAALVQFCVAFFATDIKHTYCLDALNDSGTHTDQRAVISAGGPVSVCH